MGQASEWPDDIFRVFRAADFRQVAYVPDAGHARLIDLCRGDNAIRECRRGECGVRFHFTPL